MSAPYCTKHGLFLPCDKCAEENLTAVTAERDALLANVMTEEKAREEVWGWLDETDERSLYAERPMKVTLYWPVENQPHDIEISGTFTALQLRAIAWWMENKGDGR